MKSRATDVIRETASSLGNTVAVCRKYYVHPRVFAADASGELHAFWRRRRRAHKNSIYSPEELVLLDLLKSSGE